MGAAIFGGTTPPSFVFVPVCSPSPFLFKRKEPGCYSVSVSVFMSDVITPLTCGGLVLLLTDLTVSKQQLHEHGTSATVETRRASDSSSVQTRFSFPAFLSVVVSCRVFFRGHARFQQVLLQQRRCVASTTVHVKYGSTHMFKKKKIKNIGKNRRQRPVRLDNTNKTEIMMICSVLGVSGSLIRLPPFHPSV